MNLKRTKTRMLTRLMNQTIGNQDQIGRRLELLIGMDILFRFHTVPPASKAAVMIATLMTMMSHPTKLLKLIQDMTSGRKRMSQNSMKKKTKSSKLNNHLMKIRKWCRHMLSIHSKKTWTTTTKEVARACKTGTWEATCKIWKWKTPTRTWMKTGASTTRVPRRSKMNGPTNGTTLTTQTATTKTVIIKISIIGDWNNVQVYTVYSNLS